MGLETPYRNVVSVGRDCQPAYQIRRVFDGAFATHIFDWIITTDSGVVEHIASNLDDFFSRKHIVWDGKKFYVDARTGTRFMHEFPPGSDFDARYDANAGKYEMLAERWRALMASEEPTLFIRRHDAETDARATAVRLRDTLRAAAPKLPFALLYLTDDPADDEAWSQSDIINRYLRPPEVHVWTGNNQAWDHLLRDLR